MSVLSTVRTRALRQISRPVLRRGDISRRTFLTIVEQGHEGWRLSLGSDPVRLDPGIHLNLPVYHTTQMVDLRESSISIPDVPITVSGSLFFRIVDGYKACFKVSDLQANIKNAGTSAMRAVLGTFSYDQVIGDRNGLNNRLNAVIGTSIHNWGVEGTRFEIQQFKPANRDVERQLELQMEAERNRRKQLLDTQAQINIAEGHKQRVILESEGHLRAKANEAEASYTTTIRNAEAQRQKSVLEAEGLAAQVDALAKSLAPENAKITPEQRNSALKTLVELKKLEQLKAIAASTNNATYFFGEKATFGGDAGLYNLDYAEHLKKGVEKGAMGAAVAGAQL
ncbi:hypothetical protein CYLTODRAFT_477878 [Cylindrobasidium torrendii FP15055 ss-10]|uniref:Band 7 domain-containing protein n=1 Tax=Cylindrobasidium torrendii FP15055 ss-10 TaxID=1314674 RepID=A0A0D7AW80_9AGAR|nr:hypothetical protein CYLTODRAFT_477878 [Cylindrobasidium torrendii FP15055 ss-10]